MFRSIPALAAVGLMAHCASYPAPTQRLVDAQSTTTAAERSGALESPQAELHLQLANEEISQARVLIANKENERAAYMLVRAHADADLALAEADEQTARAAAQKALADIEALQKSSHAGQEVTP